MVTMATKRKKIWMWIIGTVLLLVLLFFLLAAAWAWKSQQSAKAMPSVGKGRLELYPQFRSQFVPPRDVAVWVPEGYRTGDSCCVLYMHDGNMLFDASTTWNHQEWRVDEVMDSLMQAGSIRPCIVVGIYNTDDRLNEYYPDKTWQEVSEDSRRKADTTLLHGDAYLQFVVKELKPFIDERYRPLTARENTFMMGSSMGGLISLYALCEYPQVFGGVACLSSHLSMAHLPNGVDGQPWATGFRDYVMKHLPEANGSLIYMDHGTEDFDADYGPYQEQLDSAIAAKGWDNGHYLSRVFSGHGHNETCWANRLHEPLQFLLNKK